MECFVALGNAGHIVLGRRIAWPEFSDPSDSGGCSLWIASRCLGRVLHSSLASSCPCSWVLVGYDMGVHDRCSGNTAVWSWIVPQLPVALDLVLVDSCRGACCFLAFLWE